MGESRLEIVVGAEPKEIVRFAAEELRGYVDRLFGVKALISPAASSTGAMIYLDAASAGVEPPREDEAFILRRFEREGRPALAAVGGSPVATLWAVYDLVERWGVRYLLRGDVFPTSPGPLHLPDVDVVRRPNLRVRGVRLINLFSMGLESWGLADIQRYLDQLAKLKFNSVYHQLWCWQPYVHYECYGVSKCTGMHWLGWRYPIDEHMIGRDHFGGLTEFVPPDFEGCRTYGDRIEVGRRLVRSTYAHAKRRGMQIQLATVVTDLLPEFCHVLGIPAALGQTGGQLGADHEALQALTATALQAYVNTYPEVDRYIITMPEFHAEDVPFEAAWERLDAKYDFNSVRTLPQVLEEAETRSDYAGGASRVVRAVKGDIVALDLFDRLLDERKILSDCAKPDADVVFCALSEELTEVYNRMRPGAVFVSPMDYTSSRVAKRPHAFERIRKAGLRPLLTVTTQDDNIGVVPQLCTASIHPIMEYLRRYDWEGFQLRYWMICDMEPTAAYLSAATWDESVTVECAYRAHIQSLCGEAAEDELIECFNILDEVTIGLGDHGLGIGFPIPSMCIGRWVGGGALSEDLVKDREQWRKALQHAREARRLATRGHDYIDYLVGRLEFGIGYLDCVDRIMRAGEANKQMDRAGTVRHLEAAVELAKHIIGIHARIALGPTDLGMLAQLNEDLYRKLVRLLDAVRSGKTWTLPAQGRDGPPPVDSGT